MSAETIGWAGMLELDHRRRLRNGALVSLAAHGLALALLAFTPARSVPPLPAVLAVDLIASLPSPQAGGRPAPAPAPKPEAAPPPKPEAAPPPPPPPVTKAPVQVLPENAPSKLREAKSVPEPEKKELKPPSEPKPRPRRRRKPQKELSYEDAMASLGGEFGDGDIRDALQSPTAADEPTDSEVLDSLSTGEAAPRAGAVVSPELAAWTLATTRRIQSKWVTPANFRGRGLATALELELSATGDVRGTPKVVQSSGDPYFDDNAVRAVLMVTPLPPPPRSGVTVFIFRSEAD